MTIFLNKTNVTQHNNWCNLLVLLLLLLVSLLLVVVVVVVVSLLLVCSIATSPQCVCVSSAELLQVTTCKTPRPSPSRHRAIRPYMFFILIYDRIARCGAEATTYVQGRGNQAQDHLTVMRQERERERENYTFGRLFSITNLCISGKVSVSLNISRSIKVSLCLSFFSLSIYLSTSLWLGVQLAVWLCCLWLVKLWSCLN